MRILGVIFLTLLALSGCKKVERGEGAGRYGMMTDNTPEYAAMKFFDSIYNEQDIDDALLYCSPRMQRILNSYHTPKNVQRHILSLSFDQVEIKPDSDSSVGRNEYAKEATVVLFLTGTYQGDKVDDLRAVELIRIDGDWKVERIKTDKFL